MTARRVRADAANLPAVRDPEGGQLVPRQRSTLAARQTVTGTLVPRPTDGHERPPTAAPDRLSPWRHRRNPAVQWLALWTVLFAVAFGFARHAVPWTHVAAGAAFIATLLVAAHHTDLQRRNAQHHHDHY